MSPDKITEKHLARKAILYVRQSSQYQVQHHEEGRRLQYSMKDRLLALGWLEIDVIDEDLGMSGASAADRTGFQRMVAEVCLGNVGAVAAHEVSRFARNNRDWCQLVEMCGLVDTLLVDHEAVYSPRSGNDRLLLGLKGSLSEYELDLLRQRSLEARRQMAARGDLVVGAPVGFVKAGNRLEKDPDRRVQEAVHAVFDRFEAAGSVRQALHWFHENDIQLPAAQVYGERREVVWKRPRYPTVMRILRNPAYAGSYAWGKTALKTVVRNGTPRKTRTTLLPRAKWAVLIHDRHEGYVSWARFERIQRMIESNNFGAGSDEHGAAKHGPALLAGLVRCRRCGRKLTVAYSGRNRSVPRYACTRGHLDVGEPRCLTFGGLAVDASVAAEVLRVVEPSAVNAARVAAATVGTEHRAVLDALELDFQAARYAADRAFKQYDRADPENRLVADELEQRWNAALTQVRELESRIEAERSALQPTSDIDATVLEDLARDLRAAWSASEDVRLKKRILRAVIEEVVLDVDAEASVIVIVIHWKGGVHTELKVARRRRGHSAAHTSKDTVDAVRSLANVLPDRIIAAYLNRNGRLTGRGNRWTGALVTSLRSKQSIPVFSATRKEAEGWLILTEAAAMVGVCAKTLRLAVERGVVRAEHPLPDGPWTFRKADIDRADIKQLVLVGNAVTPAGPSPGQAEFDFTRT